MIFDKKYVKQLASSLYFELDEDTIKKVINVINNFSWSKDIDNLNIDNDQYEKINHQSILRKDEPILSNQKSLNDFFKK